MRAYSNPLAPCLILAAALVGCGKNESSSPAALNVDPAKFVLTEEPDGAVGVIAARESAHDGAPLVLVGRVGGAASPWIEGRSAFMLLDASMTVVAEGAGGCEGQLCTGDCCATERLDCTTLVKVVDEAGRVLPVDSRELLGLRESDMVVVKGMAKTDDSGNFTMLATGVYVRN